MFDYSDAPDSVARFLHYKHITQGRSEKTVFQYYHDLRTFGRYLMYNKRNADCKGVEMDDLPFSAISDEVYKSATSDDIYEFISYTAMQRDNKEAARKRKISCLKNYYKFLVNVRKDSAVKSNPTESIETPKKSKKLPKFLTLEESVSLLSSVEGNNAIRDYCIITMFLNCGMRVSELVGINLSDISPDLSTVNVTGKGSKERIIYLNSACQGALKEYFKIRNALKIKNADKDALFVSRNHNRMSVQTVQWMIYKRLNEAGLGNKKMSVHKLRHTAATLMYQYGKTDVRVLKDILGHEQLSTTQIYTHLSNDMIRDAVNDNPLANIKGTPKTSKKQKFEEE